MATVSGYVDKRTRKVAEKKREDLGTFGAVISSAIQAAEEHGWPEPDMDTQPHPSRSRSVSDRGDADDPGDDFMGTGNGTRGGGVENDPPRETNPNEGDEGSEDGSDSILEREWF